MNSCVHCGRGESEHRAAEREGAINHMHSLVSSKLEPLVKQEVPTPAANARGLQMPRTPADPILRYLLIQKGIITPDEIDAAENMLTSVGVIQTKVTRDAGNS